MMPWDPLGEKIKSAAATGGAYVRPPLRPVTNKLAVAEKADDFPVRRILEQAHGGPASVEAAELCPPGEYLAEPDFIDIIIPHPGEPL